MFLGLKNAKFFFDLADFFTDFRANISLLFRIISLKKLFFSLLFSDFSLNYFSKAKNRKKTPQFSSIFRKKFHKNPKMKFLQNKDFCL